MGLLGSGEKAARQDIGTQGNREWEQMPRRRRASERGEAGGSVVGDESSGRKKRFEGYSDPMHVIVGRHSGTSVGFRNILFIIILGRDSSHHLFGNRTLARGGSVAIFVGV